MKEAVVIGAGFSGIVTSAYLAKYGYKVTVLEKNETIGGRSRQFSDAGFTFDMGPSWYWMPEVFENFYNDFGYKASDFYELVRLDPSYQVFFEDETVQLPASIAELYQLFEHYEQGSSEKLKRFLASGAYKYKVGMTEFVQKPSLSIFEFFDFRIISSALRLQMFRSISKEIRSLFKHEKLIKILEFPVLFLGATPQKIPALYSLMNYADMQLGTWYPMGGMHEIIKAMKHIAVEQGVEFKFGHGVERIESEKGKVVSINTTKTKFNPSVVVSSADYHHTEMNLLKPADRSYTEGYWEKRVMAPSSLLFYIGTKNRIGGLKHHNLFFDENFQLHTQEIYENPKWPTNPLFYVSCPSKTDKSVAPVGCENLFILMPLAPGLEDTEMLREKYFNLILKRLEEKIGVNILDQIMYKKSFCINNFQKDYNAFKGNAYGLANTLAQTAFLKPKMKSKKLSNLYFTGQLTVPGPGVPPAIISGEMVAKYIADRL